MADLPRRDRTPADPWLTGRGQGAARASQVELAVADVVDAALAEVLAAVWRVMFAPEKSSLSAAVTPPHPEGIDRAGESAWLAALVDLVQPLLRVVFAGQYDRVASALRVGRDHLAQIRALSSRLSESYWASRLAVLAQSVNDVFEQIRAELADARTLTRSTAELADRIARVLQLDAPVRELRRRITAVEQRMFNTALPRTEQDALWERRHDVLHRLFLVDGRAARARGLLRLAEAVADTEPDRAARLRGEAATLTPAAGARAGLLAELDRIDATLFRNPELSDAQYRILSRERRDLIGQARADEQQWRHKVTRIARTETMAVLNGAALTAGVQASEVSGETLHKRWLATSDERTRHTHWDADGQTVPLTDTFTVGGARLAYPGDPAGPPGEVIQCRCTLVLVDDEEHQVSTLTAAVDGATVHDGSDAAGERLPNGWRGVLAPLGVRSGDGRMIMLPGDGIRLRTAPIPLLAQPALEDAHQGAQVVGRIDRAWVDDRGWLMGEGAFDLGCPAGAQAARTLAAGYTNGVSVDLDDSIYRTVWCWPDGTEWTPPDTGGEVCLEDVTIPDEVQEVWQCTDWRLMAATMVAQPAFDEARLQPVFDYVPESSWGDAAMIALRPADPAALAVPGGLDPADLHVTLAYLGKVTDLGDDAIQAAYQAARNTAIDADGPITATVAGYGALGGDDPAATVLFLNGPSLGPVRASVWDRLAGHAQEYPAQHEPPIAHMTLGYGIPVQAAAGFVGQQIVFDALDVAVAGTCTPYPLGAPADTMPEPPVTPAAADAEPEGQGDSGADGAMTAAGTPRPPRSWFDDPGLAEPTALRVDDDGRVRGHLALWSTCHTSWDDVCVTPPRTSTGYAMFHTGEAITDGGPVLVGKITLGTGHADGRAGARPAVDHYDNTGTAVAVVRAGEDEHGIWVAGSLVDGVDETQIAVLRRSPLSGDWRRVADNLELVAALAVNVPGFPVRRTLAASAGGVQVSLIAAGATPAAAQAARGTADPVAARQRVARATVLHRQITRGRRERVAELVAQLGI